MNFQTKQVLPPLKVIIVNPLALAGQMILMKILAGKVFGDYQLIDLILMVHSNEITAADNLKLELISCAFSCYNSIVVSTDIPRFSDADVFCFISNLSNPNKVELKKVDSERQFNALYLIIKVASYISNDIDHNEYKKGIPLEKTTTAQVKSRKPIIMADGLAVMDIIKSLSKNIPSDQFFCPTAIPDVAKSVLADHLKVQYSDINDVLVWAANDDILHVEINKRIVCNHDVGDRSTCNREIISKNLLQSSGHDHTQFSLSWLKKEFIEKVVYATSKNPYGPIFRAAVFSNALKDVWEARSTKLKKKMYCNLGVVSDGSLGTIKGYPYILPLVICGESWTINNAFEEDVHLRNELKRINKQVKEQHEMLIPYCKKFLEENVINEDFISHGESSTFSPFRSEKASV